MSKSKTAFKTVAFVSRGEDVCKSPKNNGDKMEFIKLGDGESVVLAPLVDFSHPAVLSYRQHFIWRGEFDKSPSFPCIEQGEEVCPGEQLDHKPSYRGLMPVVVEGAVQVLAFSWTVAQNLRDIDEALGGFEGVGIRMKRNGTGTSTTYTLTPLGKKQDVSGHEVPDLLPFVGPLTRADILAHLVEKGFDIEPLLLPEDRAGNEEDDELDDWDAIEF